MTVESRIERLSQHRPQLAADMRAVLAAELPDDYPSAEVSIIEARRGGATMQVNSRWVHSSIAPAREAARMVDRLDAERAALDELQRARQDGTVLLGLGLGYLLEAATASNQPAAPSRRDAGNRTPPYRRHPFPSPVVAVCFHPDILRHTIRTRTTEWWCDYGPQRLVPAWLPGTLVPFLQRIEIRNPVHHVLGSLCAAFEEQCREAIRRLEMYRERSTVNKNTLRRFGKLWVRNTMLNVVRWGELPGIDRLVGIAAGVPMVVCGAGPTLDEVMPYLPRLRREALIIAVDTAVPALEEGGIVPDFAVITDPQYWNTRHLDRLKGSGEPILVAEPATHPRTLRLWNGPKMVSASLFPLGGFFDARAGRVLKLGAGGSVATSAWDLARVMGARHVALAGVDLAFPGLKTHCENSYFEQRLVRRATRLKPAEHGLRRYLHGAGAIRVPAAGGGEVVSDTRMNVYRSWFEEQNIRRTEVETVLLSGAGSKIPGIGVLSPERWLESVRQKRSNTPVEVRSTLSTMANEPLSDGSAAITELQTALNTLREIARRGNEVCTHARSGSVSEVDVFRRLNTIDAEIQALPDRELAGFIAGEALEEITATAPQTTAESIAQAERVYQAIEDAADYHLGFLSTLSAPESS